jgi:phosphate transport system permease protein
MKLSDRFDTKNENTRLYMPGIFPRRYIDLFASRGLFILTLIPVGLVIGIGITLIVKSIPIVNANSIMKLLAGTIWKPLQGLFGYLPFITGTLWVTLLAVIIAVPPCLLTAIYLSEYARNSVRSIMRPLLDLLAAIPSVVYGVWGILIIVPWVQTQAAPFFSKYFGHIPFFKSTNPTGFSVLSGAIVLAVMIAPFIIAVTYEVMANVPLGIRQASLAMGATRWQTSYRVVIPSTLPGIIAGMVLGLSRALGETMAVLMVVGNVVQIPKSIFDTAYPLPALIANNYGEMMSIPLYDSALMGAALILLAMILILNISSTLILRRIMGRVRRAW